MTRIIRPLAAADETAWRELARSYHAFYETRCTPERYAQAWTRLMDSVAVQGLGAEQNGRLVGIAHCVFHASPWTERVAYLEDLFVDTPARGQGTARALIEAVADLARAQGASRLYWSTHEDNTPARALYDRVAVFAGFIRYDHPLRGHA